MHDIIKRANLPEDVKKFLETKFDCINESCKGFTYYACLCRNGTLSDSIPSITNSKTPCFATECEQGSDINMALGRVLTQVDISNDQIVEILKATRRSEHVKSTTNTEKKSTKKPEISKKKERPTCSHPDCKKKLRVDSMGGMCMIHYKQSLKEKGEPINKPKRTYKKKAKSKTTKKTTKKRTKEVSAYQKFIESLRVLKDAVDDVLEKAEELGPVVPENEIMDYIKNKLEE